MTGRLADTDLVVVAGCAVANDSGMIKYCLGKIQIRGVMTIHAVLVGCGWNVVNRFANTDHIVVT